MTLRPRQGVKLKYRGLLVKSEMVYPEASGALNIKVMAKVYEKGPGEELNTPLKTFEYEITEEPNDLAPDKALTEVLRSAKQFIDEHVRPSPPDDTFMITEAVHRTFGRVFGDAWADDNESGDRVHTLLEREEHRQGRAEAEGFRPEGEALEQLKKDHTEVLTRRNHPTGSEDDQAVPDGDSGTFRSKVPDDMKSEAELDKMLREGDLISEGDE